MEPNNFKKRRLLDVAPPQPSSSSSSSLDFRVQDNWSFGRLPSEVIHKSIFSFLKVQDLTNLSHSCRQLQGLVQLYRGPLPHIVREELCPPKLSYTKMEGGQHWEVNRVRTIRFLLQTHRHGVIQVEFKLGYLLWTQLNHQLVREAPHTSHCWVEVKIYRQIQLSNGTNERVLLFENVVTYHDTVGSLYYYLEGYDRSPEQQYKERHNLLIPPAPLSVQANQRDCVYYLYQCARRIAHSPQEPFHLPNLDYLMDQAIPPTLQHYLQPYYYMDPIRKAIPPRRPALWKCRKNGSFFLPTSSVTTSDRHGQSTLEFHPYDIPGLKEWYPRPTIIVHPKNVLQSLPADLVMQSKIMPFLEKEDQACLQQVCVLDS